MAWTLCTKADVLSIHATQESLLQDWWSDTVEAMIKRHVGTPYMGELADVEAELHDGDGTNILVVNKPPIASVQSLLVNDVTLVAGDYAVFPGHIALPVMIFPQGKLNIKVSYTSGLEAIDPIVRMTAVAMIIAMDTYRGRMGADMSLKWSDPQKEIGEKSPNQNVGLTSHLDKIMRRMLQRDKVKVR